jgi:hypothetical protein
MKPKKLTDAVVKRLLKKYGTHTAIADQIGITYRRYCQIRQRGEKLSRRLSIIIEMRLTRKKGLEGQFDGKN